ncbi:helix-turn-helix domain-containing protein, partial [Bacteroides xylanisolvens]
MLNSIIHFTFADEKQDAYQYMDKEFSNIRIVDIAKMAGVSVGTVDRVIHN